MTDEAYRILITGSRTWTDGDLIRRVLEEAVSQSGYPAHRIALVHGTAQGADQLAAHHATDMGMLIHPYPADWNQYGKKAGFIRNSEMVKAGANICLAFIKNESRGASMTRDLARKAGIKTVEFKQ